MKTLLEKIDAIMGTLHEQDAESFIWWFRFAEFVEQHEKEVESENNKLLNDEYYNDHPDFLISQDFLHNKK